MPDKNTPLRLTKDEMQFLGKHHPDLFAAWHPHMEKETLESFETQEELEARAQMLVQEGSGEYDALMGQVLSAMENGKDMMTVFEERPADIAIKEILFCIGATGLSVMLHPLLNDATQQSFEGLVELTDIRHEILLVNALPLPA